MFRWLRGPRDGLAEVERLFVEMLRDGRHVFDLAMQARLGGAAPEDVADELHATEERTDEAEREIRRRVVVHASVHGSQELAASLMYMSIGKDAERIGDLSRGIFNIAERVGPPPPGPLREDLHGLSSRILPAITGAGEALRDADHDAAEALIVEAREVQAHYREQVDQLLREELSVPQPVASALTYRHCGRIMANVLNIASAVVMPLDQLDYPTPSNDP